MRSRFKIVAFGFAAWAGLALMGLGPTARADLEIQYSTASDMSGAVVLANDSATPGLASFTGTQGGVTMDLLSGLSDSPGTPTFAQLNGSTLEFHNNTGSAVTFYLTIGSTDFTGPTTPPAIVLDSELSTTLALGATTLSLVSYVDQANGQNTIGSPLNAGTQTVTGENTAAGTAGIASLASPFSITEYLTVSLGADASVNFVTTTTLTSIPEPSTMALAGLGSLGLITYGLRRRKNQGD